MTKLALLGAGATAATVGLVYWARRRARATDPLAPSQDTIDALDAIAFEDLPDEGIGDYVEIDVIVDDVGELYGVHTPRASDTGIEDGDEWMRSLEMAAAEGGPVAEHEVDPVDEIGHPHSDTRDRPVADKGAGGRGGL